MRFTLQNRTQLKCPLTYTAATVAASRRCPFGQRVVVISPEIRLRIGPLAGRFRRCDTRDARRLMTVRVAYEERRRRSSRANNTTPTPAVTRESRNRRRVKNGVEWLSRTLSVKT